MMNGEAKDARSEMRAVCINVEREAIGRRPKNSEEGPTLGDALALALADDPVDADVVASALYGLVDDVAIAQYAVEAGEWGIEGMAPFMRRMKGRLEALAIVQMRARRAMLDAVVVAQPPAKVVPGDVRKMLADNGDKWSPWTIAAVAALHERSPMPPDTWVSFLNLWEPKLSDLKPEPKALPSRRARKRA